MSTLLFALLHPPPTPPHLTTSFFFTPTCLNLTPSRVGVAEREIMKKNSTAIILLMEMFVLQDGVLAVVIGSNLCG